MSEQKVSRKVSRRDYLKYAAAGIVIAAGAAAGAYYVTTPKPPPTQTETFTSTPSEKKIRVLSPGYCYAAPDEEIDKLFTEQTGIEVEATYTGDTSPEYQKLLADWVSGTTSYDVIEVEPPGWMLDAVFVGYLQPIDDLADELKPNGVPGAVTWDAATWDGHVWAVPDAMLPWLFYYRKDIFEKVGIEKPPETWEELLEVAKQTTLDLDGDGKIDVYGLATDWADDNLWINVGAYFQNIFHKGFDEYSFRFTHDMKECLMNDEGAVMGLEFMKQLRPYINPESINIFSTGVKARIFQAGGSAMIFNMAYQHPMNEAPESKVKGKVGMALCPGSKWAGKKSFSSVANMMLSITKNARNVEGAKEYLRWRNSEAFSEWLVKNYGEPPLNCAAVFDKYVDQYPHWQMLREQSKYPLQAQFITPADSDLYKRFEVNFQKFLGGTLDAKTALDMFVKEANDRLALINWPE